MELFSIYDHLAKTFGPPVSSPMVDSAIRDFSEVCMDPQSKFARQPLDYTLFHVGRFDEATGNLTEIPPQKLLSAMEAIDWATVRIQTIKDATGVEENDR